ncbi:MAG TPA: Uma2 family endonuclease [Acidimicrobiales bacterium]|jgi:Uma2 family endonuclease|nr:Uma2 family endonuclease [Acidimicrobiales bacterium]
MAVELRWGEALTAEDLEDTPDDGHRYELVDGCLIVTPAPNLAHQELVGALHILLHGACPPGYKVILGPFDFKAGPATVLEPDLLVARSDDFGPQRIEQAPLLVVEVSSPSTRRIDRGTKRLAFEAAGVAAYWLVDPDGPSLTVLHLEDGTYAEHAHVTGHDAYEASQPFPVTVVPARLAGGG